MADILQDIISQLSKIEEKLEDLQAQAGETNSILVTNSFPNTPYNNQVVIRTDLSPPVGGQLYRYDETVGDWLRVG